MDVYNKLSRSILKVKEKSKALIFYCYTHLINGFASTLDENEAKEFLKRLSVKLVFLKNAYKLYTIHSCNGHLLFCAMAKGITVTA